VTGIFVPAGVRVEPAGNAGNDSANKDIRRGGKKSRRTCKMAKKSRGGRMTAAKKRAAKRHGGKGAIKKRAVGRNIMKT
jgi:hypothetical protein